MMSIDVNDIEVEVMGRFTSLTLRGDVSYGFCRDVTLGHSNMFALIFLSTDHFGLRLCINDPPIQQMACTLIAHYAFHSQ